MPDSCEAIQQKLVKLHLTHRPFTDDPEVKAHLDTCLTCRLYNDHLEHDERELTGYAQSLDTYVENVKEKLHQSIAQNQPRGSNRATFPWWAVAAAIPLIAALVFVISRGFKGASVREDAQRNPSANRLSDLRIPDPDARAVEVELDLARRHLEQNNVAALLELLDSDYDETRVRAARYLGQIGDRSALSSLNRLARHWDDMTTGNPYAQAIAQIENRLLAPEPRMETPDPNIRPQTEPEPNPTAVVQAPPVGRHINPDANGVRLQVVVTERATGQPLSGVTVSVPTADRRTLEGLTDEDGVCRIGYEETTLPGIGFRVHKTGYVGMAVEEHDLTREISPRRVTFALAPATVIGGWVQDPNGQPIAGAKVSFGYEDREIQSGPYIDVSFRELTDAQGRWRCNTMPKDIKRLYIRVTHPEFAVAAAEGFGLVTSTAEGDFFYSLREQTFSLTLDPGQSVAGYVFDDQREAVSGALLEVGARVYRSDHHGRFEISHFSSQESWVDVVIKAEGFPPTEKRLALSPQTELHEIVLSLGETYRGRVVDPNGDALTDVRVTTQLSWKAFQDGWNSKTDANGLFELKNLPDQNMDLGLYKQGYMRDSIRYSPGKMMETVVLFPVLNVTGTVVDVGSGSPVREFKIVRGSYYKRNDTMHWETNPGHIVTGEEGEIQCQFEQVHDGYALLIEAEGYLPARSRTLFPGEEDVTLQVALVKGKGLNGQVVGEDGEAIRGASIFVAFNDNGIVLRRGTVAEEELYRTKSDAEGRFVLHPRPGVRHVVAVAEGGVGSVPLSEFGNTGIVLLEPWASVEGELFIGSQSARGVKLEAMLPDETLNTRGYWGDSTCVSDEQGHFFFPKIPPGPMVLYHHEYRVEPGQHLRLRLGGEGRTVTGQFHLDSTDSWMPFRFDILPLNESVTESEPKPWHSVRMDNTGRFRHDNLAPGRYALCGFYTPRWIEFPLRQQSRLWHEFTVPPLADEEQLDVPLPLDDIELIPGDLEPGNLAPPFELATTIGDRIRLSDFRGKLVLLSFYRQEECVEPTLSPSGLELIYRQVGQNERFVMLGLVSHDPDARIESDSPSLSGLPWPQAVVGPLEENRTHIEYDVLRVDRWPWNILVGPDGTVLAIGLEGEELLEAIEVNLP